MVLTLHRDAVRLDRDGVSSVVERFGEQERDGIASAAVRIEGEPVEALTELRRQRDRHAVKGGTDVHAVSIACESV
jgi:hypothetical protein